MNEAATPAGGAEASARPAPAATQPSPQETKPASITERLKAAMYPEPDKTVAPNLGGDADKAAPAQEAEQQAPAIETTETTETTEADDAQETEANIRSINELAEGLGWETDRVLDLEVPVKINGKEGKVPLRDALKSYQLEGHLNQGLMKLAEERKAFEAETGRKVGEFGARIQQLNQAVGLAQKILDGEFADVNWQELQRTDPAGFQAKYGAYQMRLDGIRQLAQVAGQEQAQAQAQQQADYQSYLAEQSKLLDTKVPEWADKSKREKDVAEMTAILSESYGITPDELKSIVDHRQILIARDAAAWRKLQKSKPATLNKVRAAPKLIRPGTQQSRAAQDGVQIQKDRAQLRRTGRVQDAAPVLKKLLFQ